MKDSRDSMGRDEVVAYLTGQGTADERENWEELLLGEEDALSLYIEALEDMQDELPVLVDPVSFAAKVMEGFSEDRSEEPRRNRWYEKAIFHYVVAASLTLVFLSSGVFDKLLSGNMDVIVQTSDKGPSYSEQVMQATSGWLDQLMKDGNK
ncbi:hypothetical protein PaeBR_10985 [Paenibacillus sp. BR2-3]|uniref:hypothetical protein n=1 Tax=Paenibacillus sp. BR2-3 TaxID=3048494 RepID=UPI003977CEDC